jgi:hypothetical protein
VVVYFVLLSHGALATLLLAVWWLPARIRERVVLGASFLGVGSGAVAFALHNSGETWRAVALDGPTIAIASAAAVCAWLLVGVLDLGPRRYAVAVFTGAGATGLGMFASSQWSVPAMLFWAIGSLSFIAMITRSQVAHRILPLAALLLSDALLIAALVWHAVDNDVWALPSPVSGAAFWLAVAAAVVRAGAVPRGGPWALLGTEAAPAVPLLVGGGAVIAGGIGGRAEPWMAVALLVLATAIAVGGVFAHRMSLGFAAAWPAALGLAAPYVSADGVAVGGVAVVVGATVCALWNERSPGVSVDSAVAISFVPVTVAFTAVAVTASGAFFRTDLAESALDKTPWVVVAALLPVALAASFTYAARIGRTVPPSRRQRRAPSWGIRALLGASLVAGGAATTTGELGLPTARELWLLVAAGAAAAVAALAASRGKRDVTQAGGDGIELDLEPLHPPKVMGRAMVFASIAVGTASLAAIVYFTYEGLRQGFI